MKTAGEQIAENRKKKGLTQQALADAVGLKRLTISKYEQNLTNPSIPVLQKIADTLDCELVIKLVKKK